MSDLAEKPLSRNTKQLLRDHARRLFARHSFEGVSMRDIATSVGVQQSAIYNHFSSKHDLLVDLMVAHLKHVTAEMRAELSGIADPLPRLEALVRFHIAYHVAQPEDVFLAYMELRSLTGEARSEVMALRRAYERDVQGILDAGVAAGRFQILHTGVTAKALLALLNGVTVWFQEGGELSREAVTEAYVQMVLQSVGVLRPAKRAAPC